MAPVPFPCFFLTVGLIDENVTVIVDNLSVELLLFQLTGRLMFGVRNL